MVASGRSTSSSSSRAPATSVDGGSRSSRWMCATSDQLAGRALQRLPAHVDERGQGGRELRVADVRERVGDGGVGAEDDRLRRHHAAGRVLDVLHQPADVLGLLRLHQLEQDLGGLRRQVGDQVGRVVGRHLLEDVGGALGVEALEDADLVLLGQLLEHVGEPLVVERHGHGGTALDRQVVEHLGSVGGTHLVDRRDQVGRALAVVGAGEPGDVAPLDDMRLTAAAQALGRLPDRDPAQHPVAGAGALHPHVVDRAADAAALDGHRAVEHLAHHQGLRRALLEPAHVEQPGRVDLPAVDRRHPGHRQEDAAATEHLGDHAEHPRLRALQPHRHHEVANLADLVPLGVEDRQSHQPGGIDTGGRDAHGSRLSVEVPDSPKAGGVQESPVDPGIPALVGRCNGRQVPAFPVRCDSWG